MKLGKETILQVIGNNKSIENILKENCIIPNLVEEAGNIRVFKLKKTLFLKTGRSFQSIDFIKYCGRVPMCVLETDNEAIEFTLDTRVLLLFDDRTEWKPIENVEIGDKFLTKFHGDRTEYQQCSVKKKNWAGLKGAWTFNTAFPILTGGGIIINVNRNK